MKNNNEMKWNEEDNEMKKKIMKNINEIWK